MNVKNAEIKLDVVDTKASSLDLGEKTTPWVTSAKLYATKFLIFFRSDRAVFCIHSSFFNYVCIFLWHLATKYNLDFYINFENVPSPFTVAASFFHHLGDKEFYIHIGVSIRRILIAYSIAVVLGIGIGVLVGRSKTARAAVLPYVEIIRPIPAVAWIPLAILMWPTEEASIVYITFLGALFPIILNTLHGVEQTPDVLVRAARSLGANKYDVFRHVVLPAALPSIAEVLLLVWGSVGSRYLQVKLSLVSMVLVILLGTPTR